MSLFDTMNGDRSTSPLLMGEDIIELLRSNDFDTRLQALNRAIVIAKRSEDWFLKITKKGEFFKCLETILKDERWEQQHQCIKFLVDAMPTFGPSREHGMSFLMPHLIPKLASSKITVRRICQQAIQTFLKLNPEALGSFLVDDFFKNPIQKILSTVLLNKEDVLAKGEIIQEIQIIFMPHLLNSKWDVLLDILTKDDVYLQCEDKCKATLKKLYEYLGDKRFNDLTLSLEDDQQSRAEFLTQLVQLNGNDKSSRLSSAKSIVGMERRLRFGIVPSIVAALVADDQDPNSRTSGLERLKQILQEVSPEDVNKLVPHLHSYLLMMSNVLNDLHFKIVVLGLDIIRITINRLKGHVEAHLHQVVSLISRHFGNQKAVIKQLIMMSFMDLFQFVSPKIVSGALRPYLENRNSRTREEVLNILTAALMTTSPTKLNSTNIVHTLVPLLNDNKRRVRLAAFEQLSVLVYLLNGKTEPLLKNVREVEDEQGARGFLEAVNARIRRQLLPSIRYDGLIEYSTPPVSDSSFAVNESDMNNPENADLKWILNNGSVPDPLDRFENQIQNRIMEFRTVSPISLAGNLATIRRSRLDQSGGTAMSRMKSDDVLYRPQAASNPTTIVQAWAEPQRQNSMNSSEVIIAESVPSSPKMDDSEPVKQTSPIPEVNNNVDGTKKKLKISPRAKSEVTMSTEKVPKTPEEIENLPPADETYGEERSAKASGSYNIDEYDTAPSMGKKSSSHHSLPITQHAALKHSHSQPQKRPAFLRAGQRTKLRVSAKLNGRDSSLQKSQMNDDGYGVGTALKKIDNDDWSEKVDGLNMLGELAENHPRMVVENLKEVTAACLNECKNLRSSVSRVALVVIGKMAQCLKTKMDSEIDKVCNVLMTKSGDVSNAFIREDASDALQKLIKNCSPLKAMSAVISSGSKAKNNTIRTSCASFIYDLIEHHEPSLYLNSQSSLSQLMPVLIQFNKDQTPNVRAFGRQALCTLSKDKNFERLVRKNAGDNDLRAVREILNTIEKRGGLDALDSTSISLSGSLSRIGSTRRMQKKLPDSLQLDLDEIRNDLISNAWERRIAGLTRLEEMTSHAARAVAHDTRLVEAFLARLNDINGKVALQAISTYMQTLGSMAKLYSTESNMKAVLTQLIFSLMSHLSSKSEELRQNAQKAISASVRQIEPTCLMPAMAAAMRKSNVKQRPYLCQEFCELMKLSYKSKPKQVEVVAMPLLWDAIKVGHNDVENKKANVQLAKTLAKLMPEKSLLDAATLELDPTKKKLLETLIR